MLEKLLSFKLTSAFEKIKQRQVILLWGLIGFLVVGMGVLISVVLSHSPVSKKSSSSSSYKAPLTTGVRRSDPKESWMEQVTTEQNLQGKQIESLQKMFETIFKMNHQRSDDSSYDSSFTDSNKTGELRQEIKRELTQDVSPTASNPSSTLTQVPTQNVLPLQPITQGAFSPAAKKAFRSKGIQKVSIQLQNSRSHKALKTTDNTIPAGAFAQAVLIGGVDASTSIQASSDPRPVLLRMTHKGTLPRKFQSDLCGCHALAACYGDISSERVYMRLEKITCTERKTGELLEMNVQGYVAGEDGRAGLRGHVVDRAGESMRNAAIGGFLSGMGSFLSQSHNPVTFSPMSGLAQTNPLTNGDLLKHGAAKGVSGALEKYADFYIKRAEQMQPVIQVQAGRVVDIVFTQGTAFGDSAARGALSRVNDQYRYQQIHNTQADATSKPAEAWIPSQGETE